MLIRLFFVLCLVVPGAAFSQTASPPAVSASTAASTIYIDPQLHFSYTYDAAIKGDTDLTLPHGPDCSTTSIAAFDATVGLRFLALIKEDFPCQGKTPGALPLVLQASAQLQRVLHVYGEPKTGIGVPYLLGDHHNAQATTGFVVAKKVRLHGKPVTFYGASSCAIIGGDIVCWVFTSADCKDLDTMMAYPIRFDGEDPAPVIPAKTIDPCERPS
jgi:hypothetical protein